MPRGGIRGSGTDGSPLVFKLKNMRRGGEDCRAIGTGDEGWERSLPSDDHRSSAGMPE
jgi:hypothetical protein